MMSCPPLLCRNPFALVDWPIDLITITVLGRIYTSHGNCIEKNIHSVAPWNEIYLNYVHNDKVWKAGIVIGNSIDWRL